MAEFYNLSSTAGWRGAADRRAVRRPRRGDLVNVMRDLAHQWPGETIYALHDTATGSWFFIAIHDTTLGPPVGGCRLRHYWSPALGLRDAMRLAEGMTYKWAGIGSAFGGGKAVIALSRSLGEADRLSLAGRFAFWLEQLSGVFETGADYGIASTELKAMTRVSRYVHGLHGVTGEMVDSGEYTARGVFAGIKAAVGHVFNDDSLADRKVVVQGVGQVGAPLARLLAQAGARVFISDLSERKSTLLAKEIGAELIGTADVVPSDCDVYAPCALGGTLTHRVARALNTRIVAGGANNQLRIASVANDLHRRKIIYAPDFIINAGAAIALPMLHRGVEESAVLARLDGIGTCLGEILEGARRRDESPLNIALSRVHQLLSVKSPAARPQPSSSPRSSSS